MPLSIKLSKAETSKLIIGFVSLLACTLFAISTAFADKLQAVEVEVTQDYPSVNHILSRDLRSYQKDDVLLFDVREEDEFAVSHLPGAIQVDPALSGMEFLGKYGDLIASKPHSVFYCSVGVRSSEMAMRVREALTDQPAPSLHNLQGGIFRWHNESLPLRRGQAKTDFVHPDNWRWGRLVNRRDLTRYEPE